MPPQARWCYCARDPRYFRPTEVETLLGNPVKAKEMLGWESKISFEDMVVEMAREDLALSMRDAVCKVAGLKPSTTTSRPCARIL